MTWMSLPQATGSSTLGPVLEMREAKWLPSARQNRSRRAERAALHPIWPHVSFNDWAAKQGSAAVIRIKERGRTTSCPDLGAISKAAFQDIVGQNTRLF